MISIRFETPGLPSGSCRTSRPESVTALLIFFRTTSGGSAISTVPCAVPPVVDIFFSGSWRSMIRAPISGYTPSGTTKVSPKRALKRSATSRESSRCWRWSSPIGTMSVW